VQLQINFHGAALPSGVYCIRHIHSKTIYIGSSVNLKERWRAHRKAFQRGDHHNLHLQRAWNKYGEAAFEFIALGMYPKDQIEAQEQEWIDTLAPRYNISRVVGSRKGVANRKEHNEAISRAIKARWADPEFKARMCKAMKGAR
jgi:group I intron endonuclease